MKKIIVGDDERIGKWVAERTDGQYREGGKCIGLEQDGKLIAGVLYDSYNGASICMHVAIEGRLNKELLWFAFYYPFEQLKVNVIIGIVPEGNMKARKFDEHLGFRLKVRIPDADPSGDLLIYTMHKHECRWLHVKTESTAAA